MAGKQTTLATVIPVVLVVAIIVAGSTTVIFAQAPPELPATIYGNVTIQCTGGSQKPAPAGIPVRAVLPNGTVLAQTATGEGTRGDNQYILKIEDYEGDVEIYVANISITTINVYPGLVKRLDINVSDNQPPGQVSNVTYYINSNGNLVVEWTPAPDNLGISYYRVKLYYDNNLIANDTTEYNNWTYQGTLQDGFYTIEITPVDLACNNGQPSNTTIVVDRSPPRIVLFDPTNNSIIGTPQFTLNILVEDISNISASLLLDGQEVQDVETIRVNDTYWQVQALIETSVEGEHNVTITLTDSMNNTATGLYKFTTDLTPPNIVLLSNINGTWINSSSLQIAAVISDSVSEVDPNSIQVLLDNTPIDYTYYDYNHTLIANIQAGEGWHSLIISAADLAGNTAESSILFGVDTRAPAIVFEEPQNNTVFYTNNINVTVRISDQLSGVNPDTIQLFVNSTQAPFTFNETTGTLTAQLFLNNGVWTIQVLVADYAGNVNSSHIVITVQSEAPEIFINSPSLLNKGPQVQVNITVVSQAGLDTLQVTVDGNTIADCNCQGALNWTITKTLTLEEGQHTLQVTALDVQGLSSNLTYMFYVDNNPPVVEESNIANLTVHTQKYITLNIKVNDSLSGINPSGITLKLNGREVDFNYNPSTDEITATLQLEPGVNRIDVKLEDRVGWTSNYTFYLLYDSDNPKVYTKPIYYVSPDTTSPSIVIRVEDDSMEGLAIGLHPQVTIQPSIGSVRLAENRIVIDLNVEKYVPYKVTLTFQDLAGNTVTRTFHLVIANPQNHTIIVSAGMNLYAILGGIFPDILEDSTRNCGANVVQVNPNWTVSSRITDYAYPVLIIESKTGCTLQVSGFQIPVQEDYILKGSGNKLIAIPVNTLPLERLLAGLGVDTAKSTIVVYHYNAGEAKWETTLVAKGLTLGGITSLTAGEVYYVYVAAPNGGQASLEAGLQPETLEKAGGNLHLSLALPLALIAAFAAASGAGNSGRIHKLWKATLAVAWIALLAAPAAHASAQVVQQPPETLKAPTGYAYLDFTINVTSSTSTDLYIILEGDKSFNLTSASITVQDVEQEYTENRVADNKIAINASRLNPANGILKIQLIIYTGENLNLNWTVTVTTASGLVPQEPLILEGKTSIIVSEETTTTAITTTTTATTTVQPATTTTTTTMTTTKTMTPTTGTEEVTKSTTGTTQPATTTTATTTQEKGGGKAAYLGLAAIIAILAFAAIYVYWSKGKRRA